MRRVPRHGVGYYVNRADRFARLAERGRTYLQPNGAVLLAKARVEPGAQIVVPEILADERRADWGQVRSSVASNLTSTLTMVLAVQRL